MNRLVMLALGAHLLVAGCGDSTSAAQGGGGGGGRTGAGGASGTAGTTGAGGGSGASGGAGASGGGSGASGGTGASGGSGGGAACAAASTEAECDALAECHAIFDAEPRTPVGTCTCPDFGCCTHFRSCASGALATCSGVVLCKVALPYCESGYTVANDGTCYVGCVKSSACAP